MFDSWIIILELSVSFIVGVSILGMIVWGLKSGQFDDGKRQSEGLLFDNEEDLRLAIEQENRAKELKEKKQNNKKKEINDVSRV